MPYGLRKLPNQELYRVYNKDTGEIHSKATTKGNALKQIRLLYMVERQKSGSAISTMEDFKNSYPKLEQSMEQDRVSGGMCGMTPCKCGAGKYDFENLKKSKKYKDETIDDDIQKLLKLQAVNEPTESLVEETKDKLDRLIKLGEDQGARPYNSDFNVKTILYLHILEKYMNPCAVFSRPDLASQFLYSGIFIDADKEVNKKEWTKENLDKLNKVIAKCIKDGVEIIVLPVTFSYTGALLQPPTNEGQESHANIVVIRPLLKSLSHCLRHG
jgi:hypothetical protein